MELKPLQNLECTSAVVLVNMRKAHAQRVLAKHYLRLLPNIPTLVYRSAAKYPILPILNHQDLNFFLRSVQMIRH